MEKSVGWEMVVYIFFLGGGGWLGQVKKEGVCLKFETWKCERGRGIEKKAFCNIHSDSCIVRIF